MVQLTNSSGNITKNYSYDAFGTDIGTTQSGGSGSTDSNPFRYAGEYWDSDTGTYYLRARYYTPSVGRFLTEDPLPYTKTKMPNEQEIIDPLSLNLYTYCWNNPVLYFDSTGNKPHPKYMLNKIEALGGGGPSLGEIIIEKRDQYREGLYEYAKSLGFSDEYAQIAANSSTIAPAGAAASGAAKVAAGATKATTTASIGTQFGKLGVLVKTPNITVNWAKTTAHGFERMAERGVTQKMVETWMRNGKVLEQSGGQFLYITKEGAAVVNKSGQVITAYGSKYFDDAMKQVIVSLFGK